MANANAPRGFVPTKALNNGPYNAGVRTYSVPASDATAIGIGDPVKLSGTGQTINGQVYTDVIRAASGDRVVGIVVGVVFDPTNLSSLYRAASTQRLLLVNDDPNALFEVQEGTGGTPLTANDVGLNINFAAGSLSTVTGYSGFTIDNSTEATTNTLDCKIIALVQREDNAIGDSAKWLVRLNKHQYVDQVAGT